MWGYRWKFLFKNGFYQKARKAYFLHERLDDEWKCENIWSTAVQEKIVLGAISFQIGLVFFPQAYCFYTGLLHFRMSIAFSQAYCLFIGLLHFHRPFAFSQAYCFFTGIMLFHRHIAFSQASFFFTGLLPFNRSIAFSQAYCLCIGLLHFHRPFAFSQTYCFFTGIMPIWFNWKKVIRKDPITTRNTTQLNFFNTGSASCFHSPPAPPAPPFSASNLVSTGFSQTAVHSNPCPAQYGSKAQYVGEVGC